MKKLRKNKIFHITIGLIFIALVFGSLSTLLSAKRIIERNLNPTDLNNAYIASKAGIEIVRNHIEINRITEKGQLPWSYHLNGALYKAEWDAFDPKTSTLSISCSGGVISENLIIGKSVIDTVITINYTRPSSINPNIYFGNN